jgi:hypothetical protein
VPVVTTGKRYRPVPGTGTISSDIFSLCIHQFFVISFLFTHFFTFLIQTFHIFVLLVVNLKSLTVHLPMLPIQYIFKILPLKWRKTGKITAPPYFDRLIASIYANIVNLYLQYTTALPVIDSLFPVKVVLCIRDTEVFFYLES